PGPPVRVSGARFAGQLSRFGRSTHLSSLIGAVDHPRSDRRGSIRIMLLGAPPIGAYLGRFLSGSDRSPSAERAPLGHVPGGAFVDSTCRNFGAGQPIGPIEPSRELAWGGVDYPWSACIPSAHTDSRPARPAYLRTVLDEGGPR